MISLTQPWVLPLLTEIHRWPGEVSDRQIRYGCVVVADVPQVGNPPVTRWVERLREQELLAPAAIRAMRFATPERVERLCVTRERAILLQLVKAGLAGMGMEELTQRLCGCSKSGWSVEEPLVELYRGGLASPPAGLWVSEKGRAMVEGEQHGKV